MQNWIPFGHCTVCIKSSIWAPPSPPSISKFTWKKDIHIPKQCYSTGYKPLHNCWLDWGVCWWSTGVATGDPLFLICWWLPLWCHLGYFPNSKNTIYCMVKEPRDLWRTIKQDVSRLPVACCQGIVTNAEDMLRKCSNMTEVTLQEWTLSFVLFCLTSN